MADSTADAATLPNIRRARGYRLYDHHGRRYLDLFQDNGHAITGHRPSKTILEIKNLLSRGQIAAYPSVHTDQALRALATLVPDAAAYRVFGSPEKALSVVSEYAGREVTFKDIVDPALAGRTSGLVAYWRPFVDMDEVDAAVLIPVLPVASPPAAVSLIFREQPHNGVSGSDICSPVSVVALKRSIYDLRAHMEACDRSQWDQFDAYSLWTRRGPYLSLNVAESEFSGLHADLMANGLVISPRLPGPSIVPGEFSAGELACLGRYSVGASS